MSRRHKIHRTPSPSTSRCAFYTECKNWLEGQLRIQVPINHPRFPSSVCLGCVAARYNIDALTAAYDDEGPLGAVLPLCWESATEEEQRQILSLLGKTNGDGDVAMWG